MMRIGAVVASLMFGALAIAPASANTIADFAINGLFDDGGTATGTFSLDVTSHTIQSVSITTSPAPIFLGATYTGSPADSYSASSTTQLGFHQDPGLMFASSLLSVTFALNDSTDLSTLPSFLLTGGEQASFFICGGICQSRTITGGTIDTLSLVTATTPIPATLPLLATALGGIGAIGWRRKRKAG
jgi:hypothetical protein